MSNEDGLSRQQIFQQMFGKMDGLKDDDYACALESPVLLHGRMYLTKTAICFYSNLFGIEKKLKLPYEFVVRVDRVMTALVIPNAIAVVTGEKTYYFRSFLERDKCYRQLSHCIAVYRGEAVDEPETASGAESKPNLAQGARAAVQNTGRAFSAGLNNFVSVFNVHKQPAAAPVEEPTEPATEEGEGDSPEGDEYNDDGY